jgi:hypothetical protein
LNQGSELCDGTDAVACPGLCTLDCTCIYIIGDGICDSTTGETFENSFDCPRPTNFGLMLGIVAAILVIIGGVAYYFYRGPGSRRGPSAAGKGMMRELPAQAPELGMFQSVPENLRPIQSYVSKMRAKGYSDDSIRQALRQSGWPDESIKEVM